MIVKHLNFKYMQTDSKNLQGNEANTLLAPVYMSIHTTCKCGKNAELKWRTNWYGNECECGTNIRMNRDKTKIIVESTL